MNIAIACLTWLITLGLIAVGFAVVAYAALFVANLAFYIIFVLYLWCKDLLQRFHC